MTLIISQATEDDISAIATIHVAGWQGAYGGLVDQSYIDSKTVDTRTQKWSEIFEKKESVTFLASIADQPVGFITYGSLRTAPPGTSKIRPLYSSEIYALYLLPEIYRQGVGMALMKEAVQNLKNEKHQSTCLWVLENNKRACEFYKALGGQRIGKKMIEIGPNKLKEVCYGWRNIERILTS